MCSLPIILEKQLEEARSRCEDRHEWCEGIEQEVMQVASRREGACTRIRGKKVAHQGQEGDAKDRDFVLLVLSNSTSEGSEREGLLGKGTGEKPLLKALWS